MALKLKLNLKFDMSRIPANVRLLLIFAPAVVITALAVMLLILPKYRELKKVKTEITVQENEIAKDQAKAARLTALKQENEKLKKRMEELKQQLPEEKEVSGLLKQVSDLGINAGLRILLWKPEAKKDHPSGIIYEIPVAVDIAGSYHSLAGFFSSLTKLSRIVNISSLKMGEPQSQRGEAVLRITFRAVTFSAMSESELAAKAAETKALEAKKTAGAGAKKE